MLRNHKEPSGDTCHQSAASAHLFSTCEACENAPATFLCKADAASLCAACDAAIHTANPLARRHHRVPIPGGGIIEDLFGSTDDGEEGVEHETDSWLVLNNPKKESYENGSQNRIDNGNGLLFGGEVEEYLNLEEYSSNHFINDNHDYDYMSYRDESVVPVDCEQEGGRSREHNDFQLGFDFECSKSGYNFNITNHGVGVSSEVPNSYNGRGTKGTIDLFGSTSTTGEEMRDREARVMRYREKKKNRKFQKIIRYASRKAYAETRPRIKGRFAKRSTQHMFAQPAPYGVVPSAF